MRNLNEQAALQLVLNDISLKELLFAAQEGFDSKDEADKANICYKAIKIFL